MSTQKNIKEILLLERIIGYLDPFAEEYLIKLNNNEISTSSSCMGRITVIEGKWHWERNRARIVLKSHKPITIYDLSNVIARPFDNLWLKVTGPIIHLKTNKISCAFLILDSARKSGFKHSGIFSNSNGLYTVELLSAIQIAMPLKINNTYTINPSSLNNVIEIANNALLEGHRRLNKLVELTSEINC
ncbi:MAG: tRNA-wybutosine modification methyltransferase TYW3 [Caldisphaera sp.]